MTTHIRFFSHGFADGATLPQTTYDVCLRDTAVLRRFDWSGLVIDEGHSLKGEQHKGFPLKERSRKLAAGLCRVCSPTIVAMCTSAGLLKPRTDDSLLPLALLPSTLQARTASEARSCGSWARPGACCSPARRCRWGRSGSTSACACSQMIVPSVPAFDLWFQN